MTNLTSQLPPSVEGSASNGTSPDSVAEPTIRIDGQRFYDVVVDLCEISELGLTRVDYFGRCFETLAKFFNATVGILNLRQGARTLERTFATDPQLAASWHDSIDALVLRTQTDEAGISRFFRNSAGSTVAYALATPIQSATGKTMGGVALVRAFVSGVDVEAELLQLNQILELVVENAPISGPSPVTGSQPNNNTLQSVVRASDYRSIQHLAFAIVNSLCSKFGCEQVGIGLVRNRNIRLIAVSGLSEVPKNTPGIMAVQQSMAACFDRNDATVVQQDGRLVGQLESSPCKLHQLWHRMSGESCVATIPLRIDGDCVAVISLRRNSDQPLMPEDLHRIRLLAESFAPALPLVDRASRSVVRHACESFCSTASDVYSWNNIGHKLVALVICAGMAWMAFGKTEYRVLAHCKIVPEKTYTVSVPHEAMISNVLVLPGQHVNAGEPMVQLDTTDLQVQQMSLTTEITSAKIEANSLLSNRHHQEAFLRQSEIDVLKSDLHLVQEQIARSVIRAPHDGVVMPTDIHRRIGQFVALGDPLLEIASDDRWHLEVEVPEHQSQYISRQQVGAFQSSARPDQQLDCAITKVSPASEVKRNKNVVIAEALLENHPSWMKIGMEGHVKIDTGSKSVWWVYLHPMIDYVRLKLWL